MTDPREPQFPIFDEPMASPAVPSYWLPLDQWNRMVALANHLAKREAEMPLRRRLSSWLAETSG